MIGRRLLFPALAIIALPAAAEGLPEGFAYLSRIDPSISQDMRYAGSENFTGHPVPGYEAAACVLARPAAEALSSVQKDLAPKGLSLRVFDCYRPARSVAHFLGWAKGNKQQNPRYHPDIPAADLVARGYIAARSGHSSGGSVDLTIVDRATGQPLDMGTTFDFFAPASHTQSRAVSRDVLRNRAMLVDTMRRHGFANYSREWWHFSFTRAPFAGRAFDFVIRQPPSD